MPTLNLPIYAEPYNGYNKIGGAASLIQNRANSFTPSNPFFSNLADNIGENIGGYMGIAKEIGSDIEWYQQLKDNSNLNAFQNQLRGMNNSIWNADFGSSEDIMQANMFANLNNANYSYEGKSTGQNLATMGKDTLSGAAIGTQFMPGIGTLIGAAAGAVKGGAKWIADTITANNKLKAANAALDKAELDKLRALNYGINTFNTKNTLMQDFNYSDMGGPLNHGTHWNDNVILVDAGGTHEANPYGGVLMGMDEQGTPNLVEEGEVIYNDYVYSNRLKVPKSLRNKYKFGGKKPMPYAEFIKSSPFFKAVEEMPNDPIVKRGFESFLGELAMSQEEVRAKSEMRKQSNRFDWGGPFYNGNDWNGFLKWIRDFNTNQKKGNIGSTYKLGKMTDAQFLNGQFKDRLALEADQRYKNFTTQIKEALRGNDPVAKSLAKQYLQAYEESLPDTAKGKLLDKDGNPVADFDKRYDHIRSQMLGSGHLSGDFDAMVQAYKDATVGNAINNAKPLELLTTLNPQVAEEIIEEEGLPIGTPKLGDPVKVNKSNNKTDLTPLRYAPIAGNIGAWFDMLANPIDYSNIERYENYAMGLPMATTHPIGNYTEYRPFDINYAANRARAQAGGRERLIADLSGGNSASARANLVAAGLGEQNDVGNLLLAASDSNLKQRQFRDTFNRETDKYNSEDAFRTQNANIGIWNTKLNALMRGAAEREALDARYSAAKSANRTALAENLGNLGKEDFIFNQLDAPGLLYHYITNGFGRKNGQVAYTGSKGGLLTVKKVGRK